MAMASTIAPESGRVRNPAEMHASCSVLLVVVVVLLAVVVVLAVVVEEAATLQAHALGPGGCLGQCLDESLESGVVEVQRRL